MKLRAYVASDWPALCAIHDLARLDELRHSAGVAAFLSLQQTAQSEGLFDGALVVAEDVRCETTAARACNQASRSPG